MEINLLQEYTFVCLDIFNNIIHNKDKKIENKLEEWLVFLSQDDPDMIMKLLDRNPEFQKIYEEIYTLCLNMEGMMEMFSKELEIMDRNTVKLMIDEMEEELNETKRKAKKEVDEVKRKAKEEIEEAYEKNTGLVIIETFKDKDPVYVPGVLCTNHGPFTWGSDGFNAVHNAVVLEECAKMNAIAMLVKNPEIGSMQQTLLEKHFNRKHGPGAYYGQSK